MVSIDITYNGDLRCTATHGPSGTMITTDAPKDNHGKGESFSPTDLVATALGTCMLTLMGIAARKLNIDISGSALHVEKSMRTSPIRQIGALTIQIHVPAELTAEQQDVLKNAALTCPVHKSLHPDVDMPIEFVWG